MLTISNLNHWLEFFIKRIILSNFYTYKTKKRKKNKANLRQPQVVFFLFNKLKRFNNIIFKIKYDQWFKLHKDERS